MKLISHHLCPYVQRAVIILSEKNVPHERVYIDLSDKPDWFLRLSPLGRVPMLLVHDAAIFESQVITEYIDEISKGSLHPADPLERARHRSWIEYASATLDAIGRLYNAPDYDGFAKAKLDLLNRFRMLEAEISGPLFMSENFHIVDAAWAPVFRYFNVLSTVPDINVFKGLKRVTDWSSNLSARPSVVSGVPDGYEERLTVFLRNRKSYLSSLME